MTSNHKASGGACAGDGGVAACPYCAHHFSPGNLSGPVFCPACGRRFQPQLRFDETICLEASASAGKPETRKPETRKPGTTAGENLAAQMAEDGNAGGDGVAFGEYDILSEVARGGMGVVYRARHRVLKRVVALKVLRSGDGASDDDIRRFMQEAKSAASLSHANIVPIHEFSVHRGQHFFTMDYIDGKPLDRLIEEGALSPYRSCELILQIARAIHFAHTRGIIHRDIKPANVIVDSEGRPMLTDFGLAVNLSTDRDSQRMTRTGSVMGTIPYIPPEQASGKLEMIGPRSDVYSLGALFYEMLTGRPPFTGMTQYELLQRVIHHYPPSPRKLKPRLSVDVETICMKCLAKEPERRYQTAAALADDCQAFLNGEVIKARPATISYRLRRAVARHPEFAVLGGVIALLGLLILGVLNMARSTAQKLSETEVQHEKVKEEQEQLKDLVKRNWRSEFKLQNGAQTNLTTDRNQARARLMGWYSTNSAKPVAGGLQISGAADKKFAIAFGCPVRLPLDFNISMTIQIPTSNPGAPVLLIGANSNFAPGDSTRTIETGAEGLPGARMLLNNTIIAENSAFAFTPGKTYVIEVTRNIEKKSLDMTVGGRTVLRFDGSTESVSLDDVYFCLGVKGGQYLVQSFSAEVRGMSREMLRSLLEMGDGLINQQKEQGLARKLYERVLREDAPQDMLIHAYNGFSKGSSRNNKAVVEECRALVESIQQSRSRRLLPGEEEYLTGLSLARINPADGQSYFQTASVKALESARRRMSPEGTFWCGPFAGTNLPQPARLSVFNPADVFTTIGGEGKWAPLKPDARNLFHLPPARNAGNAPVFFYVAQMLPAERACEARAVFPAGCRLWLNGRLIRAENAETAEQAAGVLRLPQGSNILLYEVPAKYGENGFSLQVFETGIALANVYGLLAKLDDALGILKAGQLPEAVQRFSALQREGTLESLGTRFPAEVRARGVVAEMLKKADEMLDDPKQLEPGWNLLEALRAIDDGSNGKELALRYNKLAALLVRAERLTEAEQLFTQAASLSPQWHLPLFERARLLYLSKQTRADGVKAFTEAFRKLPESLELRLATADFFLAPDKTLDAKDAGKYELKSDPAFALEAALSAVDLSGRKNPQALSACALALFLQDRADEALQYNEEARLLEETPERAALSKRIRTRLGR